MDPQLIFTLIATFGAICMEAVHWYELRNKLEEQEQQKLLRSKYYWIITILMIVISGIGTYLLFYEPSIKKSIPFVLGAAFPVLFKKAIAAAQERHLGAVELGGSLNFSKVFKAYLQ